jgi:hypothetical protein
VRSAAGSAIMAAMGAPPQAALRRAAALSLLLPLAATQVACVTRSARTLAFKQDYTEVYLRSEKKGMKTVPKGYEHPVYIAQVRMAHILSRIDLRRKDDQERVPAIPLETLFVIAEGASKALAEANPNQAVAVQSIRRDKHWGIFERQYLTSLLVYMKDGLLFVQISRSDWEIPRDHKLRLPETYVGEFPRDFRLVVERGMALADQQTAAVDWRDPIFKKPTRTRVTPTGRVVRRTILMESPEGEDETDYGPELSGELTPEQLRALADLEEERRSGSISESEYTSRRSQILRGEGSAP